MQILICMRDDSSVRLRKQTGSFQKRQDFYCSMGAIEVFFYFAKKDEEFEKMVVLYLVLGFALLVVGADQFVLAASNAARKLGVPSLIIGLTVVAFGTSAPELAVSVTAAIQGANEIAVGNIVGSNIFNLLVVAGISAVVCPIVVNKEILKRDWPLSVIAAVLLLGMVTTGGTISRIEGLILLAIFFVILAFQIKAAMREKQDMKEVVDTLPSSPWGVVAVRGIFGLAAIIIGGQLTVNGATGIARMFGLTETLIGLTIVAIGTSLPELVTSIAAARRGENDIAMGNVIGSNLFNILLILGLSAVITPITVLHTAVIDCAVLIGISVVFFLPAWRKKGISRPVGASMVVCYVIYTIYLIFR